MLERFLFVFVLSPRGKLVLHESDVYASVKRASLTAVQGCRHFASGAEPASIGSLGRAGPSQSPSRDPRAGKPVDNRAQHTSSHETPLEDSLGHINRCQLTSNANDANTQKRNEASKALTTERSSRALCSFLCLDVCLFVFSSSERGDVAFSQRASRCFGLWYRVLSRFLQDGLVCSRVAGHGAVQRRQERHGLRGQEPQGQTHQRQALEGEHRARQEQQGHRSKVADKQTHTHDHSRPAATQLQQVHPTLRRELFLLILLCLTCCIMCVGTCR